MGRFVDRRLQELQDLIRRYVRGEMEKRDVTQRDALRMQALAEKSFYYLSEDEIRRMKEAVTKLAQRLKNVVSIRRRTGKRGQVRPQRTRCGRTSSTAACRSRSSSTGASATSRR